MCPAALLLWQGKINSHQIRQLPQLITSFLSFHQSFMEYLNLSTLFLSPDCSKVYLGKLEMAPQGLIAVIGIGCRFAGDVDRPSKFWELIENGRQAW